MKRGTLLLSAMLLFFYCSIQAQPPEGINKANTGNIKNKWLDIPYATLSAAQKLDIYLPDDSTKTYPVIISIHGGAFMFGDKADGQVTPMLAGLKQGYAVVSINYRLSGEALFPANINDVKAAIRWVKTNAALYKLNPDKIALWGGSAGGNLSALAGTSGDVPAIEDGAAASVQPSSRVQAVVDWFGPTDFLLMDAQLKETGNGKPDHSDINSPESKLMGQKITAIPAKVQLANPETYISTDDPPFLMMHGTKDPLVPTQQSINFASKLTTVLGKDKVTLHLLEGAKHGSAEFESAETLAIVFNFLDNYLR